MKNLKYIICCLSIVIIAIIITQSLKDGRTSSNISSKLTEIIINISNKNNLITRYTEIEIELFVRKAIGHFGMFFVLGTFITILIKLFCNLKYQNIIYILCVGLIISIISEVIQFIPNNRGPSVKDILLNLMGYMTAVILVKLSINIFSRFKVTKC